MEIAVIHQEIVGLEVDGIVLPCTTAAEALRGGSAQLMTAAGVEVQEVLQAHAPLTIGEALLSPPGDLVCQHVILTAMASSPLVPISLEHLQQATLAALQCAEQVGLRSLAFPDMDLSRNVVSAAKAAQAMVRVLRGLDSKVVKRVLLADARVETVKLWEEAIDRSG